MDPARWQRIDALFAGAAPLAPEERAAFLERECAGDQELRREVEALLVADGDVGDYLDRAVGNAAVDRMEGIGSDEGLEVGPYRLVREIGRGGMGAVYLAERVDDEYRTRVAVKLIRSGLGGDPVRRFRTERQILANLQHPNIARLLDGGTAPDGRPYFVLEYVEGEPVDDYCDRLRLGTRERLQLFRQVCLGVGYAHQRLVVHRDLKPGNVLVDADGTPKLLDFGIAKLLEEDAFEAAKTATGLRLMTPLYASPEQVRGDPVTTSSDVYSLGVLLYELLTGRLPYGGPIDRRVEVERAILYEDPPRPSTAVTEATGDPTAESPADTSRARGTSPERLRRTLSGDLDTILLKALRKEPARRYDSVEQLSEDVRRYLEGLPVRARPDTLGYRAGKFVRRNRGAVLSAVALLVSILGFAVTMWLQAVRIEKERQIAEAERLKAESVADFLIDVFEASDPNESRGMDITAREILAAGGRKVREELSDQPEVQAAVMEAIGRVYRDLGSYDSASVFLESSVEGRADALGTDHPDYARSLVQLGMLHRVRGEYERALELTEEAHDVRVAALGRESAGVAETLNNLGVIYSHLGRNDEALETLRESFDLRRRLLGEEDPATLTTVDNLALSLDDVGRYDEAAEMLEANLTVRRRLRGTDHMDVAYGLNNLASVLERAGRYDESEPHYRESLEIRERILPPGHPAILVVMNNLAGLHLRRGEHSSAEEILAEVIRIRRERAGEPMGLAVPLTNRATALTRMERHEEAVPLFRESLALMTEALGEAHVSTTFPMLGLANALADAGRHDEAATLYGKVVDVRREGYGGPHENVAFAMDAFGTYLLDRNRREDAAPLLEGALSMREEIHGDDHPRRAESMAMVGLLRLEEGRPGEAEPLLRRAEEVFASVQGADGQRTIEIRALLGEALVALGRLDEGKALLAESYRSLRELAPEGRWTRRAAERLATADGGA